MLPTTSKWMRHLTNLVKTTAGASRHDYRHEIRLEVGLGIRARIHILPTRHLSYISYLYFQMMTSPFPRACCRVLHVTCILVRPHAPACIHVHLHGLLISAGCRMLPARISSSQKWFFFRVPRALRAFYIACRVHHVPHHAPKYIRVHLRASTCIHTHPWRSCVRRKREIENYLNISDYM